MSAIGGGWVKNCRHGLWIVPFYANNCVGEIEKKPILIKKSQMNSHTSNLTKMTLNMIGYSTDCSFTYVLTCF